MKIFILEDDPARMLWFRERLIAHHIDHAESCAHIDRFQPPYDLIFLDHDLGGRQMTEHEDDGTHFARLIASHINGSTEVIVHSYNADGAQRIRSVLMDAGVRVWGHAPFRGNWFNALVERLCL